MEDEATSAVPLEYVGSAALVETSPAPESLIQETNVELSMEASSITQHPVPTPMSEDRSPTQLSNTRTKLASTAQCMYGNWRTGLEIGVLTVIILMVWVLFSIPTILYALPPEVE